MRKLLFLLLIFPLSGWAVQESNEAWSVLTLTGKEDKWIYMLEPQYRVMTGDTPVDNQTLINVGGGYQVSPNWQLWLGSTGATTEQDTENSSHEEYRLWQQAFWSDKWQDNTFSMRSRLEERKSLDYEDLSYRFRDRLMANIPISDLYSLVFSYEFFINLNKVDWVTTGTWDSNRWYGGIWKKLSPSCQIGIGYLYQEVYTDELQSDNVLVLNLQVNL
jgi:hypothetical protein